MITLISACAGLQQNPATGDADMHPAVTGTISYRESVTLPPDASIEVSLLDVSLMDVAAKVISRRTIKPAQTLPIPFSLPYDPEKIDQRMTYAVQARIEDADGSLMFVTDTSYQVLTRDQPDHVDLVLKYIPR